MKKLFNIGPSLIIDDFSSLQITGPYSLLNLGPNFASIRCEGYTIEATGVDLTVDKLMEEIAVFTFTSITKIEIRKLEDNGELYG